MTDRTRLSLAISPELLQAIDAKRGDREIGDVVRERLAHWVGKPSLAKMRPRGRPPKPR